MNTVTPYQRTSTTGSRTGPRRRRHAPWWRRGGAVRRRADGALPWAAPLGILLLLLVGTWWGAQERADAVAQLPATERTVLFEHTRAIVEQACPRIPLALQDHCRLEAELLLTFPECDDTCRAAARGVARVRRGAR